jgi:branched-chain amino acid transport system permease protein
MNDKQTKWNGRFQIPAILIAILLAIVPILADHPLYRNVFSLICLWAAMSGAWNILGGYAGKFSLGNAAFFGTGAYVSSILFVRFDVTPWLGLCAGVILSMILALFLGIITMRLKGKFFSLCTIAFLSLAEIVAINWRSVTGGAEGFFLPWKPGLRTMMFESDLTWNYVFLAFMLLTYGFCRWAEPRPLGYRWAALRENEDAAEALGVNTLSAKLSAFVASAALTSAGGSLYAQYCAFIEPVYVFGLELSIQFALCAIIGGMGTALGPILGAAVMTPLQIFLRSSFPDMAGGVSMTIYAFLLILVVLFMPRGFVLEGGRLLSAARAAGGRWLC